MTATQVIEGRAPRSRSGWHRPPGMVTVAAVSTAVLQFILAALGRSDRVVLTVLLASLTAFVLGGLSRSERVRFLFDVHAITMIVGVVSRLALLTVFSASPKFERFTTTAQLLRTLDRHPMSLFLLMTLPLLGFVVGDLWTRMVAGRPHSRPSPTPTTQLAPIIFALATLALVFGVATPNVLEAGERDSSTSIPLFMIRLVPVGFLPYAALSLLRDPNARRRLVYAALALLGITGLIAARKGALLTIPFAALLQLRYFRQFHLKPPRQLRRLVAVGAVLGPVGFALILAVRLGASDAPSAGESMEVLSERVSIVDGYASTVEQDPPGVEAVSVGQIVRNAADSIIPAGPRLAQQPQLGVLFGQLYQGHKSDVRHSGAWTFWGLLDTLNPGRTMFFALFGWALLLVLIVRRAESSSLAAVGLVPFLVERLCFTWLLSGNVDRIIALTFLDVLTGMFWFVFVPSVLRGRREHHRGSAATAAAATGVQP